jgi:hypothetical protein
MSLQRDINKKLDEILDVKAELIKLKKELSSGASMKNIQTGKRATKKDALNAVAKIITELEKDLSTLTNNGKNVRGLFDNPYYINDVMQDKQITKELEQKKLGIKKPTPKKPAKRNKERRKPKQDPPKWDWGGNDENPPF